MIDDFETAPQPRFSLLREFPWAGVVAVFDWKCGVACSMSENAFRYYQEDGETA